jgi:hypothetical protein
VLFLSPLTAILLKGRGRGKLTVWLTLVHSPSSQ